MKKNVVTKDAILYNGNVHIQYKYNNKMKTLNKHNQGFNPLFTAITLSLGGRTADAKKYIPKYLMATNADGDDCLSMPTTVKDTSYYLDSNAVGYADESNTIRYTFIIPASSLIEDMTITKLQLENEEGTVCATIDLEEEEHIHTNLGASLLIYWDLDFSNPAVE